MFLDIFNNDAFTLSSMSQAIDKATYTPTTLLDSGVFTPEPIRTESFGIETRKGSVSVVPYSQRGEKRTTKDKTNLRSLRNIETPRLAVTSTIRAHELAFLREFGTEDQIIEVQKEIANRQFGPTGLVNDVNLTLEKMAMGAIDGIILDHNGDELYNYFTILGETASPAIGLALTTLTEGDLRKQITQKILRPMRAKAQGAQFQYIRAICGATAFDNLSANPEYYATYLAQQAGAELRETYFEKPVRFAGVEWVEYQGTDDGVFKVADNEIKFVPWGNNNIFSRVMSPGESFSQIGQMGQALYSSIIVDDKRDEFVDLDVSTYSLMVNRRPDMTIKCTVT
jgi:hypothetical protein